MRQDYAPPRRIMMDLTLETAECIFDHLNRKIKSLNGYWAEARNSMIKCGEARLALTKRVAAQGSEIERLTKALEHPSATSVTGERFARVQDAHVHEKARSEALEVQVGKLLSELKKYELKYGRSES